MVDLVVVGLGYVGLPLVQESCRSGLAVVGVDLNESVVSGLNNGRSHVDDLSTDDVSRMLESGFRATTDFASVHDARTVVICVPHPWPRMVAPTCKQCEVPAQALGLT